MIQFLADRLCCLDRTSYKLLDAFKFSSRVVGQVQEPRAFYAPRLDTYFDLIKSIEDVRLLWINFIGIAVHNDDKWPH